MLHLESLIESPGLVHLPEGEGLEWSVGKSRHEDGLVHMLEVKDWIDSSAKGLRPGFGLVYFLKV